MFSSRKYPYLPHRRSVEIPRGRGWQKQRFLEKSLKLNWNFQRGGRINSKNLPWGRYRYFYEPHNMFTKNCLSQVPEQSGTGSHSAVTNFHKNSPERSIPYVITQIRNCAKLLNLAPNRSF